MIIQKNNGVPVSLIDVNKKHATSLNSEERQMSLF
jgi:hypothetical protein